MIRNYIHKIKTHVNSLSPAAKASFWFVVANVTLKGISFITTPIFTRLLDVSDYGITSVFVAWEGIISIFATLVLSGAVYNIAMTKYEEDIDRFTSSMLGLTALCSVSVYAGCILFNHFFPQILKLRTEYLFFMWVQTFTNASASFWLMRKRFLYHYKSVIAYTFANALGNPVIAIIAIRLFPDDKAYAKIIGSGMLAIIIGSVICIKAVKAGKNLFDKGYWKFALRFNIPLLPHYLAGSLTGISDKLIINSLLGSAAAGIYSISHSIIGIVSLITTSINMSLIPYTLQSIKSKNYGALRRTTTACLLLVSCFCAGVALFSREAILILATRDYLDAAKFVAPLSFATVIFFLSGVIGNIVFYYEKTGCMSVVTLTANAVNIGLNYAGIRMFGAIAAAYVAIISNTVTFCGCYYLAAKYEHALQKIIDLKGILVIFAAYGFIVAYALVFAENFMMRFGLVLFVGMLLIIFRKGIVATLKTLRH